MPVTAQSMAVTAAKLKHELADLPLDHPNRPGLEHMARLECSPQARGCSGNEFRAYFVLYGVPRRRGDVLFLTPPKDAS